MAIELHHLQPVQDNELSILKARIADLEKLNHELEEERRWRKYMGMVLDELQKAEGKHPKFCDSIIDPTSSKSWAEAEYRIKLRNQRAPENADNVLMEEIAEAFAAYEQGDKEHAFQEFAQCGAVIMRIMDRIEKEMESNG